MARQKSKNVLTKKCKICNKEFIRWIPPENHNNKNTFCSRQCYLKFHATEKEESKCQNPNCDNSFIEPKKSTRKFCSRDCYKQCFDARNFASGAKRGIFYSRKHLGKGISFDSSWELKRLKELDNDEAIKEFDRAKVKIPYFKDNGKKSYYHPDFEIEMLDGTKIIEEVKGRFNSETTKKIAAGEKWCKENNFVYRIIGYDELYEDIDNIEIDLEEYGNSYGRFYRPTFNFVWMQAAITVSKRSTCLRNKVGCVIVTEDLSKMYSYGYNGSKPKQENGCKSLQPGQCGCIHAEINALNKLTVDDDILPLKDNAILFCTTSPCLNCAEEIVKKEKIKKVVYLKPYRDGSGLKRLRKNGIITIKYDDIVKESNTRDFFK